ncbi:hypothetical protein HG531_005153 [Fusarium graminearum]|nr:hypothetical protein HG531_005153 [Fusarium graminearum]
MIPDRFLAGRRCGISRYGCVHMGLFQFDRIVEEVGTRKGFEILCFLDDLIEERVWADEILGCTVTYTMQEGDEAAGVSDGLSIPHDWFIWTRTVQPRLVDAVYIVETELLRDAEVVNESGEHFWVVLERDECFRPILAESYSWRSRHDDDGG